MQALVGQDASDLFFALGARIGAALRQNHPLLLGELMVNAYVGAAVRPLSILPVGLLLTATSNQVYLRCPGLLALRLVRPRRMLT